MQGNIFTMTQLHLIFHHDSRRIFCPSNTKGYDLVEGNHRSQRELPAFPVTLHISNKTSL